jgi:hypothetical protein
VLELYKYWTTPTVIVSDGAYGVGGFEGDPLTYKDLEAWYTPHIQAWSEYSTPQTTLWFWNTEIGWATVHPILEKFGWEYRACNIWNKGIAHIAGNSNTQSLRQLPVVTEVCVQYVKKPQFIIDGKAVEMKYWLRHEWLRTGLPLHKTNEACGVKNAASRKYFTLDHLWYFPPSDAFEKIVQYANQYGNTSGKPYFSLSNEQPLTKTEWEQFRAKFYCPIGVTNVWDEAPVNGQERLKRNGKALHLNQKPLKLISQSIAISSDESDMIWEPFGGLCTVCVAADQLSRSCVAAEINKNVYHAAIERLRTAKQKLLF